MKSYRLALLVLMIAATAFPVFADTDYGCLQNCMTSSKRTASACMPQCITNPAPGTPKAQTYTDYRCLQTCVSSGKQSATCLPECTYQKPADPAYAGQLAAGSDPSSHKVFEAPKPAGDIILHGPQKTAPPDGSISTYPCINQCVQGGMQYQLCSQRCVAAATTQVH